MKFYFHPKSEDELNDSIDYYEKIQSGLGFEFADEIYSTIDRIISFPESWQKIDDKIRRCLVNRFPFAVIYYQKEKQIIILAIMHLKRKPNYWKNRK